MKIEIELDQETEQIYNMLKKIFEANNKKMEESHLNIFQMGLLSVIGLMTRAIQEVDNNNESLN